LSSYFFILCVSGRFVLRVERKSLLIRDFTPADNYDLPYWQRSPGQRILSFRGETHRVRAWIFRQWAVRADSRQRVWNRSAGDREGAWRALGFSRHAGTDNENRRGVQNLEWSSDGYGGPTVDPDQPCFRAFTPSSQLGI